MFENKEIVWAKVKGYPWWPAEINKLPSEDHNYFKVSFIGENNHAFLEPKAIKKYHEHYNTYKHIKCKGLLHSIQQADAQIEKRKVTKISSNFEEQMQQISSLINDSVPKQKRIKRKGKGKKLKKSFSKNIDKRQQVQKHNNDRNKLNDKPIDYNDNRGPVKKTARKLFHRQEGKTQQKNQNNFSHQNIKANRSGTLLNLAKNNSGSPELNQQNSCVLSLEGSYDQQSEMESEVPQIQNGNVNRKKIQVVEEQLCNVITWLNSTLGSLGGQIQQCQNQAKSTFQQQEIKRAEKFIHLVICIQNQEKFLPQQLLQSKITNMLTFIEKRFLSKIKQILKRQRDHFQKNFTQMEIKKSQPLSNPKKSPHKKKFQAAKEKQALTMREEKMKEFENKQTRTLEKFELQSNRIGDLAMNLKERVMNFLIDYKYYETYIRKIQKYHQNDTQTFVKQKPPSNSQQHIGVFQESKQIQLMPLNQEINHSFAEQEQSVMQHQSVSHSSFNPKKLTRSQKRNQLGKETNFLEVEKRKI